MKEINISNPLVTVVMPVYNDQRFVLTAINSIREQKYKNLELIIVDDGSTDNTPHVLEEAVRDEPRFRVVTKTKNEGTASGLNKGFFESEARGTYYTWCSSDNIYYPNFLVSLVKALELNKNYDFAYTDFDYLNEFGQKIAETRHKPIPRTDLQNGYDLGPGFLWRRSLQEKIGKYWNRICEDYFFAAKACAYTEFLLIPEILMGYRIRPGQITGSRQGEETSAANDCKKIAIESLKYE